MNLTAIVADPTLLHLYAPQSDPSWLWADSLHRLCLDDLDDLKKLRMAPRLADAKFKIVQQWQLAMTVAEKWGALDS